MINRLLFTQYTPLLTENSQQTDRYIDIITRLPDWVGAIAAIVAVATAIWGAIRILNELQLRAIDSVGGFYAQLKAHLVVMKHELGENAKDSILRRLYAFEKEDSDVAREEKRKQFREKANNIVYILTTAKGQLPLSAEMLKARDELIMQLTQCQQWQHMSFYEPGMNEDTDDADTKADMRAGTKTALETAYDNFKDPILKILAEIDRKVPALLFRFWRQIDKADLAYRKRKGRRQDFVTGHQPDSAQQP